MRKAVATGAGLAAIVAVLSAFAETNDLQPRDDQVATTNAFMRATLALHNRVVAQHDTRTAEDNGGYKGYPDFFREVRYYDRDTDRLLSKVQWERTHPDRLHAIEVYVYDDSGRVTRDFSGWYLPNGRNAPRDTWITLHAYSDGLHAVRQFDALDNRLYELCEGTYAGKPVKIALWEMDIPAATRARDGVMQTDVYRACFAGLPLTSAGRFLTPQ